MLMASLLDPNTGSRGDYWYCLADRNLYECVSTSSISIRWLITPPGAFISANPPMQANPQSIWIDRNDPNRIPHQYSTANSWIPVVPYTFQFPILNPVMGDIWVNPLSLDQYTFDSTTGMWAIAAMPSLHAHSYTVSTGNWAAAPGANAQVNTGVGGGGLSSNPYLAGSNGSMPAHSHPVSPNYNLSNGSYSNYNLNNNTISPQPSPSPPFGWISVATPVQSALKIVGLVEIFMDGHIVYDPSYTPDATAKAMWEAIGQYSPAQKESREIASLRMDIGIYKDLYDAAMNKVQFAIDRGFKFPEPDRPTDPNAAWDLAMGIIV